MATIAIVGGGLASARVVKSYREAGGADDLVLVSADAEVPYHRPPLSKRYLRGEIEKDGTFVEQPPFYAENRVDLRLGTRVERLDTEARALELGDGTRVAYDRLVLATGATPRRLGVPGEEAPNVFRLRTLADSTAIRDAARGASRAVVVGSGFIGCEVTASLRALGVDVSLVARDRTLFWQLRSPHLSDHLVSTFRREGVELCLEDSVAEFRDGVAVTHGGRELPYDLAVVGVGVTVNVDLLEGTPVEVDNGVVVDERFETAVPGVYAAGDVAAFWDTLFERRRRIEHWSNANYQGAELGKLLAGGDGRYDTVSTFFTEIFGTSYKVFGDTTVHDEQVVEGSFEEGKAVVLYLADGRVVGALLTGQDEDGEARLKTLIAERAAAAAL